MKNLSPISFPASRPRAWILRGGLLIGGIALVAACGGSSGDGSASGGAAKAGQNAAGDNAQAAVSVRNQSGVGQILIDPAGRTLYSATQEKNGKIRCMDGCTDIWLPATSPKAMVDTPDGVTGKLATIKRPDTGKLQLTYDGSPLYTFSLDAKPGDVAGNGVADSFGGTNFSWQAAGATVAAGPAPSSSDDRGNNPYPGGNY